jgi:hypothetical protein
LAGGFALSHSPGRIVRSQRIEKRFDGFRLDRLGEVVMKAGVLRAFAVFLLPIASDSDERHHSECRIGA